MVLGAGEAFPNRTLPDLEGQARPILEGAPRLVLLGHRDCKTTRQTLPYVDRIHKRREGASVAVLQDTEEVARELARELGLELPLRLEATPFAVAKDVGATTVPTLFLVDAQGKILKVSEGFRREDLEGFAQALGVKGALFDPDDRSPAFRPG